jgi:hypothetical protein
MYTCVAGSSDVGSPSAAPVTVAAVSAASVRASSLRALQSVDAAALTMRLCARALCNFAGDARSRPKMSDHKTVSALVVLIQVLALTTCC